VTESEADIGREESETQSLIHYQEQADIFFRQSGYTASKLILVWFSTDDPPCTVF